jgi:hypothetical protein
LEKIDRALEESLGESRIHNVRGIVAQHLGHILVDDVPVHLLEANEVLSRELRSVTLVECLDDLRK